MANVIKLTDTYVDTSSVYDSSQNKTQAAINVSNKSSIETINSYVSSLNSVPSTGTAASGTTRYADGLSVVKVYNSGYPESYGNAIRIGDSGQTEIFIAWSGTSGAIAGLYFRNLRDVASATWSPWQKVTATQV